MRSEAHALSIVLFSDALKRAVIRFSEWHATEAAALLDDPTRQAVAWADWELANALFNLALAGPPRAGCPFLDTTSTERSARISSCLAVSPCSATWSRHAPLSQHEPHRSAASASLSSSAFSRAAPAREVPRDEARAAGIGASNELAMLGDDLI